MGKKNLKPKNQGKPDNGKPKSNQDNKSDNKQGDKKVVRDNWRFVDLGTDVLVTLAKVFEWDLAVPFIQLAGSALKSKVEQKTNIDKGNHPWWYAYNGVLMVPAANYARPMDVTSVRDVTPHVNGTGTMHVSHVSWEAPDSIMSEGFELALIPIWRTIEARLRSNKTYNKDDVMVYVAQTTMISKLLPFVLRNLVLPSLSSSAYPDFQELALSYPDNPYTPSFSPGVSPTLAMLNDSGVYADQSSQLASVMNYASQLIVPSRIQEYYRWMFSNIFVDSDRANATIYFNEIRSMPLYRVSMTDGHLTRTYVGDIDPINVDLTMIRELIQELVRSNASLIADMKEFVAGTNKAAEQFKGYFAPLNTELPSLDFQCDPEYFAALNNAYTMRAADLEREMETNGKLVRIDLPGEIDQPEYSAGVINGLAYWAGADADVDIGCPLTIIGQSVAFTVMDGMSIPYTRNGIADWQPNSTIEMRETYHGEPMVAHINMSNRYGVVYEGTEMRISVTGNTFPVLATSQAPAVISDPSTVTSIDLNWDNQWVPGRMKTSSDTKTEFPKTLDDIYTQRPIILESSVSLGQAYPWDTFKEFLNGYAALVEANGRKIGWKAGWAGNLASTRERPLLMLANIAGDDTTGWKYAPSIGLFALNPDNDTMVYVTKWDLVVEDDPESLWTQHDLYGYRLANRTITERKAITALCKVLALENSVTIRSDEYWMNSWIFRGATNEKLMFALGAVGLSSVMPGVFHLWQSALEQHIPIIVGQKSRIVADGTNGPMAIASPEYLAKEVTVPAVVEYTDVRAAIKNAMSGLYST